MTPTGAAPRKRRRYKTLDINRVDLVDRGANFDRVTNDGSHILLVKRDSTAKTADAATPISITPPITITPPIAKDAPMFPITVTPSTSVTKIAEAAVQPADAAGQRRIGAAFAALRTAEDRRAVVDAVVAKACAEATRTHRAPCEVIEALAFDAADALRRADPTLSEIDALLKMRAVRPDLRYAAAEVAGLRT